MSTPLSLALALLVSSTALAQSGQKPAPQPPPEPRAGAVKPAAPAPAQKPGPAPAPAPPPAQSGGITAPVDYVIGPDDVLDVVVWREKELSTEVKVRPDGKVSLPLLNDVQAAGLTPEEFRKVVTDAAAKFVAAPSVTVMVKQINSRIVFVLGEVGKTGPFPLTAPTTVLQLLALAGGPTAFAKTDEIKVMRTVDGKTTQYRFNYKEVMRGRNIEQNIPLRPGDTVIVP